MADISNVINVELLQDQSLAVSDNINACAIITTDNSFLNSNKRYAIYATAQEVANDFGSNNIVSQFANTFFAQQPNPINAGGELIIGYWRAATENLPATNGYLKGSEINPVYLVPQLQQVDQGNMTITIDAGSPQNITDMNFSSIATIDDAVLILQQGINGIGATATFDHATNRFKITSNTTGATSAVSFVTGSGNTFVGSLLGLVGGQGGVSVAGIGAQTLSAEAEIDALDAISALITFKGFTFIDQSTGDQRYQIAGWCQANRVLGYDTFADPNSFYRDVSIGTPWKIKIAGYTFYRMNFSTANNRQLSTAYMSRNHTVNFNAENSAITMNLKSLTGILAESYSQTQITNADIIGLDLYTTIKNVPVVLTSSGNDFVDNVYNLISYIEAVQVGAFNLLRQTATKIPQTTQGVNTIVDTVTQVTKNYVSAGVFAPGTWTSTSTFGNLTTFLNAIDQNGYYILAGLLANQSPVDRAARKSPVIQVAVKNAGAVHSMDIIINFNL
jgi:hypothetical protein